jgi:putative transposase
VVTPNQQRAAADYLVERFGLSQRRAGRLLDQARSTLRYRPQVKPDALALVRVIRRLARRHPAWGYRLVHARLRTLGWTVNLKRVRRLWLALGLKRSVRLRKPRKLGPKTGTSANSCVAQPAAFKNDVWTCDFLSDRTTDGKPLKWLSVADEYTRECLVLTAATAMSGAQVRRHLARVIGRRGAPRRLRSDNGSEFVCAALTGWLPSAGTEAIPVAPGSPWENGYIESFHGRARDEFFEREEFASVTEAQMKGRWYRREYNRIRPHSALAYKTPKVFSDECDRGLHGQPPANEGIDRSVN